MKVQISNEVLFLLEPTKIFFSLYVSAEKSVLSNPFAWFTIW